jgi:hypothetical protein
VNPAYNDYVTTVGSGSTELKIVDELAADGTEINREEDLVNGTVYILNQATGFKLSGKEKPLTLTGKVPEDKHINPNGSPWWIAAQALPKNPVYIDLEITYDSIKIDSYEVKGVISTDEFKDATIEKDLNKVSETRFDTHTIEYNEDRHK